MASKEPPLVSIEHWSAYRVTAGDEIERWTVVIGIQTIGTFEDELSARRFCREHGWQIEESVQHLGWLTRKDGV